MSAPDELWAWVDHNGYLETWVGDQPNERAVRYVRAPTAPQGAEIARVPDDNMLAEGAHFLSAIRRGTVTGTDKDLARGMFMRMHDAALTPTDAETKND